VLELAVDEGRRLNHHYIGTEHLLLGLVREGEGIAAGVLAGLGVDLHKLRVQVMRIVSESSAGPSGGWFRPIGLGPAVETLSRRSLALLVRAFDEAAAMGYPEVDTGHLLIAVLAGQGHNDTGDNDELAERVAEFRRSMREVAPPPNNPDMSAQALNRDARSVMERSHHEARIRQAPLVEPEHILLAITLTAGSLAEELNRQLERLIQLIRRRTGEDPKSRPPGAGDPVE
jgi:ATP-dependent Clp protease ATP-binding subunit ClpA